MRIGVVGGTGKEGRGMALRWARAGHDVFIGSRDAERARASAEELSAEVGRPLQGGDNASAVRASELVGPLRAEKVGAGRPTQDQRPSGEHRRRRTIDLEDIRHVLRCVTRRGECVQRNLRS